MKIVFLDTSAFIALKDESEINHNKAIDCFNSLIKKGNLLLTTNYIFDEVYTILIKRFGQSQAVDFGKTIRKSRLIQYFIITEEIEEEAWNIAVKYKDKSFSFTDCTSFAIMKTLGINKAFAFDEHFKQFGLEVVP